MFGYIYKTTCLINQKIYIGKHSRNISNYYGSGKYFKMALQKYGKQNFKKEILEQCDSVDILNMREKFWIAFYNATKHEIGYNLSIGGECGKTGFHLSEESKQKMSLIKIGKHRSEETKHKISEWHKGKHLSDETKQKMREHNGMKGKHHSEESKQKMSLIKIGKHRSEETKQKISEHNAKFWKGKSRSDETRQKISITKKKKHLKFWVNALSPDLK